MLRSGIICTTESEESRRSATRTLLSAGLQAEAITRAVAACAVTSVVARLHRKHNHNTITNPSAQPKRSQHRRRSRRADDSRDESAPPAAPPLDDQSEVMRATLRRSIPTAYRSSICSL